MTIVLLLYWRGHHLTVRMWTHRNADHYDWQWKAVENVPMFSHRRFRSIGETLHDFRSLLPTVYDKLTPAVL